MYVIKASGEKEEFDRNKILNSMRRAGASNDIAERIVENVEKKIYDGIPTRVVFKSVMKELNNKTEPQVCTRYNLKQAIAQLGPAGFTYEKFFAEVLENYGYQVEVGRIMKGKYIKLKSDYLPNVIFNTDSLNVTEELFITEGVADCISIAQAGYSCISPVTVRFKKEDYPTADSICCPPARSPAILCCIK